MEFVLVGIPLLAFAVGFTACRIVRAWALRTGFVDHPGERKIHTQAVPYGGGIAVVCACFAPILLGAAAAALPGLAELLLPEAIRIHLPGIRERLPELAAILAGGLVIHGLGHVDDRRKLSPAAKFAVEIAVSAALAASGVRFSLFLGATGWGPWLAGAVTVIWITGVANAMNFLDNMDGLCGGIAAIAGAMFLVIALQTGQLFIAFLLLALIGACLAFLCHNFPPASLFLGDSGSLFLGYFLAVLTVLFTFYRGHGESALLSFSVPLFILAVPIHDAITVIAIRLRTGHPIWRGDNRHLSHRLVQLGFSRRGAVLLIYLLTLCTGISGTLVFQTTVAGALIALLQVVLVLLALSLIEATGRAAARRGHGPEDGDG